MEYKYSQKRDLSFLRNENVFNSTPILCYWQSIRIMIKTEGDKIVLVSEDGNLVSINKTTGIVYQEIHYHNYEGLFPFNTTASDLIDTIWYLIYTNSHMIKSLFYNNSSRLSNRAIKIFSQRLRNRGFNSVDEVIINYIIQQQFRRRSWAEKVLEYLKENDLEIVETFTGRYAPREVLCYENARLNGDDMEEELVYRDGQVMYNLGFQLLEEEDDDETDEDGNHYTYEVWCRRERTRVKIKCSCGAEVEHQLKFGNKCIHCIKCPPTSLEIRSYSTKAEEVFQFKIENKRVQSKASEKFSRYYSSYMNNIGISLISGQSHEKIYIGAELEYQALSLNNAKVEVMELLHEHCLLKSDSSVREGFEIVSKPALYDEHVRYFKPFFENFPANLRKHESCGLHFHVSKAPLSLMTQGKMIEFMNREENKDFIIMLAERESEYARFDTNSKLLSIFGGSRQRYSVLNTCPSQTLEFRMFAPAITWENFAYKMEFCLSLTEFCAPCSTDVLLKDSTLYTHYKEWLSNKRKTYPNLYVKIFGEDIKKSEWLSKHSQLEGGTENVHSHI